MNRVILIGASNVTMAFPRLVNGLGTAFDSPLEIWGAHGHGRSYGTWSKVLGRALPGISNCRLWKEWSVAESDPRPRALLTDIGNDVLYGHESPQIIDWIESCLQRLRSMQAKIVMTRLPLASLQRLSRLRFTVARRILFPRCALKFDDVIRIAHELDDRLTSLGEEYGANIVEPLGHWYGLDPIHVRSRCMNRAWRHILQAWFAGDPPGFPRVSLQRTLNTWRWWPAERSRRGRLTETTQPVFRHNGLTVRLY
ncbi:MAG: hypothetical protein CMJ65_14900 [Planctomycetaceae bacterium]|jgi:hypothetical protein|nr:hypothetical protein [Planctomycetaceae bacterium]MDP7274879.1 hypothetical protein [Planctomycetaceae bacterium]